MSYVQLRFLLCVLAVLSLDDAAQAGQQCEPSLLSSLGGYSYGLALDGDVAYVANAQGGIHTYDVSDPADPKHLGSAPVIDMALKIVVQGDIAYAACSDEGGLQIFDVANPAEPVRIASLATPDHAIDLVVAGDVCYLAASDAGLQIIDVSTPTAPSVLSTLVMPGGGAVSIALSGDHAFVAARAGGLQVVDVSNSVTPTIVGSFPTPEKARDVEIAGDRAYLVDDDGLRILNISNPTAPSLVSATSTTSAGRAVAVEGELVYVGQRFAFQIFDVTTPLAPAEVASFDGNTFDVTDIAVRDGVLYMLLDEDGLLVYDVTEPATPALTGAIDSVNRAWGVAADARTLAVGDLDAGLQLIDISDPQAPRLQGLYQMEGAVGVCIAGDLAFVGGAASCDIVDISDPWNPVRLSTLDIIDAEDIVLGGETLYIASSSIASPDLTIVDISDAESPQTLGALTLPSSVHRTYDIALRGGTAYLATGSLGMQIIDVSDPTAPSVMHTADAGGLDTAGFGRGIAVAGDYAYLATSSGLRVVYIKDPSQPLLLSWADPNVAPRDVVVVGAQLFVADSSDDLLRYSLDRPHAPLLEAIHEIPLAGIARKLTVEQDSLVLAKDTAGVFVFDIETCIPAGPADLSGDGVVDATDLAIMIAAWGSSAPAVDLDADGVVGTSDLAILLAAWT